jgi:hypothetical protein
MILYVEFDSKCLNGNQPILTHSSTEYLYNDLMKELKKLFLHIGLCRSLATPNHKLHIPTNCLLITFPSNMRSATARLKVPKIPISFTLLWWQMNGTALTVFLPSLYHSFHETDPTRERVNVCNSYKAHS